MQIDFHYYATYCAAYLAGYSHDECMEICYSAQFVDLCTVSFLSRVKGPRSAATTQLQLETMDTRTDLLGLQYITRIWASFHFLPYDLHADPKKGGKRYKNKYRLICNTNGDLLGDTVDLARNSTLQAVGIAMHVLADTWAHKYFAGIPSLVINNTDFHFTELVEKDGKTIERPVKFIHSPGTPDDIENGVYVNTLHRYNENSIMNLGHGRAGHLPDLSFARYKYVPAWGNYEEILKDNPSDFYHAFAQMVYAMKYLRGVHETFETGRYDTEAVGPLKEKINEILTRRQLDSCADWKALGKQLSGREIEEFDLDKYVPEYTEAGDEEKEGTFLGKFFLAALRQKSMVTNRIYSSGNWLAGISVDFNEKGFKGIRDFARLISQSRKEVGNE